MPMGVLTSCSVWAFSKRTTEASAPLGCLPGGVRKSRLLVPSVGSFGGVGVRLAHHAEATRTRLFNHAGVKEGTERGHHVTLSVEHQVRLGRIARTYSLPRGRRAKPEGTGGGAFGLTLGRLAERVALAADLGGVRSCPNPSTDPAAKLLRGLGMVDMSRPSWRPGPSIPNGLLPPKTPAASPAGPVEGIPGVLVSDIWISLLMGVCGCSGDGLGQRRAACRRRPTSATE
jgi:hypothetical protein